MFRPLWTDNASAQPAALFSTLETLDPFVLVKQVREDRRYFLLGIICSGHDSANTVCLSNYYVKCEMPPVIGEMLPVIGNRK